MADNDRIKVIGYAQRVFFNDGIEYRNFSEDLVGNQQTEGADGNSSQFTNLNFVTTTNFEGRASRIFSTKKYSDYYCLDNLGLDQRRSEKLLDANINVTLNMDPSNLCSFAYFGSATEYIRVTLEKIITNWPASLYLNPFRNTDINTEFGTTVDEYTYNINTNTSTFKVDTNFIDNKFSINYKTNGTIADTFNEENDLRNLTVNYASYVILINEVEYPVIGFTGSTNETDDYLQFNVKGNPFFTTSGNGLTHEYHIKPKKELEEEFFNGLSDFEGNLLNRLSNPKFTSKYTYKIESDTGIIIEKDETLTWPVTDGYNIDFNTTEYINYVTSLINIANSKDSVETNLMVRFLTSESISDFDTIPNCEGDQEETAGQKMNRTLKIYGREFDEIKRYTDGISFANVVSYDKKNNTPDEMVKYLARVLGWELVSSLLDNDLISQYLNPASKTYEGYSRGLTPSEAEVEMWRRLILNSAFIWKSKGTRKAIEFFFKFIGAPDGLVNFNEHVYVVKEPLDMDLFYAVLENNNLSTNLSGYTVDEDGYPKFFRDNGEMYFQKGGGWYRETAGSGATQYTLVGNNPHVGPYDGGYEYIAQLENVVPSFTPFTLTSTTITSGSTDLFTNYNNGIVNDYSGDTYVDVQNDDGVDLSDIVVLDTRIITDPCPTAEPTDCGCDIPENDESLIIDVEKIGDVNSLRKATDCEENLNDYNLVTGENLYRFDYKVYDRNGNLSDSSKSSDFISAECCNTLLAGDSYYVEEFTNLGQNGEFDWSISNAGYICCRPGGINEDLGKDGCGARISCQWLLAGTTIDDMEIIDGHTYLRFIDPAGNNRVVNEADSSFCSSSYTSPVVVKDPYTGKQGYGCRLNELGVGLFNDDSTTNNHLYRLYESRANGDISCSEELPT